MAGENLITVDCSCVKKLRAPLTSAGKKVKCPGCGATLEIPAPIAELRVPIARKSPNPVQTAAGVGKPLPQAVLSYRTPGGYAEPSMLHREFKLVVAPINASFPTRCLKCNAPVEPERMKRKTMYWQHPAWYATLLLGVWVGVIILICVRTKTSVTFGLCAEHRTKRRNLVLIGWGIALSGLGLFVLAFMLTASDASQHSPLVPVAWLGGVVLVFASLIWAVFATATISIRRIDGNRVWFGGAGKAFLSSL